MLKLPIKGYIEWSLSKNARGNLGRRFKSQKNRFSNFDSVDSLISEATKNAEPVIQKVLDERGIAEKAHIDICEASDINYSKYHLEYNPIKSSKEAIFSKICKDFLVEYALKKYKQEDLDRDISRGLEKTILRHKDIDSQKHIEEMKASLKREYPWGHDDHPPAFIVDSIFDAREFGVSYFNDKITNDFIAESIKSGKEYVEAILKGFSEPQSKKLINKVYSRLEKSTDTVRKVFEYADKVDYVHSWAFNSERSNLLELPVIFNPVNFGLQMCNLIALSEHKKIEGEKYLLSFFSSLSIPKDSYHNALNLITEGKTLSDFAESYFQAVDNLGLKDNQTIFSREQFMKALNYESSFLNQKKLNISMPILPPIKYPRPTHTGFNKELYAKSEANR